MTSRERVIRALNHREPDRVPIDQGGHGATTMNKFVHKKLMSYLGYNNGDAPVMDLLQQYVDERLRKHFGSDFRPLWWRAPKKRPDEHFRAVGEYVDVVCLGDDFGMECSPWMSLELYRKYFNPREKELCAYIRGRIRSGAKFLLHSCGSVYQFIREFIDVGINALTPLQVSAKDMETDKLKREYGKDITFWGGIDTQRVLPFGSTKDVEEEVKRRIRDLAPGGGYVLAQVHNIQPGVPLENILRMYEASKKYGMYPINC